MTRSAIIFGICISSIAACAGSTPPAAEPSGQAGGAEPGAKGQAATSSAPAKPVDPDEMAAYEAAKPVFERFCAKCHSNSASDPDPDAVEEFDMTNYPFGGEHATEMGHEIREVLGAEGEKATMPEDDPGSVQDKDLELVLAWTTAFDRAHPGSAHEHDEDEDEEHEHEEH